MLRQEVGVIHSRLNRLPFDREELAPPENKPSRIKAPSRISPDSVRRQALLYLAAARIDKDRIIWYRVGDTLTVGAPAVSAIAMLRKAGQQQPFPKGFWLQR